MAGRVVVSTRARLAIALCLVVVVLCVLIGTAITHASTYYLTVAEVDAKGSSAIGMPITVSGVIDKASIHYDASTEKLQFQMKDSSSQPQTDAIQVSFHGAEPDDFNYGWPVIVTGTLATDKTFDAQQLLVKCPSKYQSQPKSYTAS